CVTPTFNLFDRTQSGLLTVREAYVVDVHIELSAPPQSSLGFGLSDSAPSDAALRDDDNAIDLDLFKDIEIHLIIDLSVFRRDGPRQAQFDGGSVFEAKVGRLC